MDGLLPITEYENARIIGLRATQLANGAKPMTDIKGLIHVLDIAEKEYREGVIPINVIRTLPSGQKIEISIVPVRQVAAQTTKNLSSDDDSSDEEVEERPTKKTTTSSSDDDSSDEEVEERPTKKTTHTSSSSDDSSDEDEHKIEVELCDNMTKFLVRKNPRKLYLFGDNEVCQGIGGQAQIRGEPNAMGIPTKKLPSFSPDAFWTDDSFKDTTKLVCRAISKVRAVLLDSKQKYTTLVLPRDGFGTGLAKLSSDKKGNTWKTLKGLKRQIYKLAEDFGCPDIGKDMSGEWKEN